MNISLYIKDLKIDNCYIKDKEINLYPLTIFSNDDIYIANIIWYMSNFHFFEFYKINDYELLSISKIISAVMENYRYNGTIDNESIIGCIDFINDILSSNKNKIISKIFAEHNDKNIGELFLKPNSNYEINISSYYESDDIINIIFTYKEKSFSSKVFFSRKIDIFIMVLENIFKILFNNNILNTLYIYDYNVCDFNLGNAHNKNMSMMDFIFKINEISQKENIQNIKNKLDLIKYYNHNIIAENIDLKNTDFFNIISNEINRRNFLLIYNDKEYINNLLSDKKLINNISPKVFID